MKSGSTAEFSWLNKPADRCERASAWRTLRRRCPRFFKRKIVFYYFRIQSSRMDPYYDLEVTDIRQERRDTKSFVLKPVGGHEIKYKPGQFLTLIFPGHNESHR